MNYLGTIYEIFEDKNIAFLAKTNAALNIKIGSKKPQITPPVAAIPFPPLNLR